MQVQLNGSAGEPLVYVKSKKRKRKRLPARFHGRKNGMVGAIPNAGRKEEWSLKVMGKALAKCYGNYSRTAKYLERATGRSIHYVTVSKYVKRHPELMEIVEKAKSEIVDVAEDNIYQIVKNRNHKHHYPACKLVVTTQGKWATRHKTELTGANDQPIEHKISVEFVG